MSEKINKIREIVKSIVGNTEISVDDSLKEKGLSSLNLIVLLSK